MKIIYDANADDRFVKNDKIAIIGYGIQGKAHALNLRDAGCNVIIGNIDDEYFYKAKKDGFDVVTIDKAVKNASIILFLIPDQNQKEVYDKYFKSNLKNKDLLVFAHGYSIHFREIIPPSYVDVCLLAPRMPGDPVREYYLHGGGVPAFFDVHHDFSKKAKKKVLGLAKLLGFTKAGVMQVSFEEETELDLFIEQFFLPLIIKSIRVAFDTLVEEGFTPEASLMELYASGEVGELFLMASRIGIYDVWRKHASPTCQYGIIRSSRKMFPESETKEIIKRVLGEIKNGFKDDLSIEAKNGYQSIKKYDKENALSHLMRTQRKLNKLIKYRNGSYV